MSRKKRTKATNARPKPKLPDGDEGKALTAKERKAKLQVFLHDFDEKVQVQLKKMEDDLKHLLDQVERSFMFEINQLPRAVRSMTVEEYMAAGGTKDAALTKLASEELADEVLATSFQPSAKLARTLSRLNKKPPGLQTVCETIPEEMTPLGAKANKKAAEAAGAKRPKRGVRGGLNESATMRPPPPPSTSRNPSSKFRTPSRGMAAAGWETPIVTPKFDPRLPVTPGQLREPNPGEMVMSMAGSPLSNPADEDQIKLRGKTLTVKLPSKLTALQDIDVDDIPKAQIIQAMNLFQHLLKKAKD